MKKHILDLKIVRKKRLSPFHFVLTTQPPEYIPEILPGQFAEVLIPNTNKVFLRRPFSIHDVDYQNNTISFLIQMVGYGSLHLSFLEESDYLNVMLPLGNGFTIPESGNILLVGGGCGVAPLLFFARYLNNLNMFPSILIGGKTNEDLLQVSEYDKYGEVFLATEDGSRGEKGMVTDHSVFAKDFDYIFTCGPKAMMKAIGASAKERNIFCEVSLENTMACGVGACLCCVENTVKGNVCTCTEGPVFNINELKW